MKEQLQLSLREVTIRRITVGDETAITGDHLTINPTQLSEVADIVPPITSVEVDVAMPDQPVRINRVLDAIEPRYKVDGSGEVFPGVAADSLNCGSGETIRLKDMALISVGTLPNEGSAFEQEDSIIDMAPPPEAVTPFSSTANVVLSYAIEPNTRRAEAEKAIRSSNARVARWLGSLGEAVENPSRHQVEQTLLDSPAKRSQQTRLAYICQLYSSGDFETWYRGSRATESVPAWTTPAELADGILMNGDYHYACSRVPTFLYQANPIIEALNRHTSQFDLIGILLAVPKFDDEEKRQSARDLVNMAAELGAEAIITHPCAGGNTQMDALYTLQEAERTGMRSVMLMQEMAGADGRDQSFVDFVAEADLLISTGNRDEVVILDEVEEVIGPSQMLDGSMADRGGPTPMRVLFSSTSQVGALARRAVSA